MKANPGWRAPARPRALRLLTAHHANETASPLPGSRGRTNTLPGGKQRPSSFRRSGMKSARDQRLAPPVLGLASPMGGRRRGRKESANARRCRHQARPPAIQGAGSRRGPPAPGDGRLPLDLAAPGRGLAVEPADERARPRAEAPPDSVRRFEIAIAAGDAGQARAKVAGDLK
jgi:hypothetical protein